MIPGFDIHEVAGLTSEAELRKFGLRAAGFKFTKPAKSVGRLAGIEYGGQAQ